MADRERAASGRGTGQPNQGNNRFRGNNSNNNYNNRNRFGRGPPKKANNQNQKPWQKKRGECIELGENVYFIGEARQADNYTKVTEAILNYIQRTYTGGNDVKYALENGVGFDFNTVKPVARPPDGRITPPPAVGSTAEETERKNTIIAAYNAAKSVNHMIMTAEIKQYVNRKTKYADNMNKAYALILGQCTLGLRNKLESRKDWATIM